MRFYVVSFSRELPTLSSKNARRMGFMSFRFLGNLQRYMDITLILFGRCSISLILKRERVQQELAPFFLFQLGTSKLFYHYIHLRNFNFPSSVSRKSIPSNNSLLVISFFPTSFTTGTSDISVFFSFLISLAARASR